MTHSPADLRWMALALALGRRALGRSWPNPAVGAVVVRDGRVLGRGWTQPGGRPHAETMALKAADEQSPDATRGASVYVTLEPCAHHGQTPPCAEALIRAGVARVVTALTDPDPRVAGRGHQMLRAAGVAVTEGCRAAEARFDQAGFLSRVTRNRPMVTLKLASSFDGRIATESGESRWITGPEARRYVHYLRATHDAVMVGSGTSRADDPNLLVRDLGEVGQPLRVVCDTHLVSNPDGRLGQGAATNPVVLCIGAHAGAAEQAAWRARGARLLVCKTTPVGHLDLDDVLGRLADLGVTRVFCEGGGGLAAGLLGRGLVDRLVGFTAGLVLGAEGRASVAPLPRRSLADHARFSLVESRALGGDVVHIWEKQG